MWAQAGGLEDEAKAATSPTLRLSPRQKRSGKIPWFAACLAAVLLGVLNPAAARAAGFALIQQGTAAMAQGNAFVAEANDPSAIFYNPAGLNQLQRPELYIGTVYNYPDREFHGPAGEFSRTNRRIYHAPALYLVFPFSERVAGGIGFFAPFGMGTVWHPEWAGRYITTYSRMKTYNLNPVISVKILKNLSVAMGPNFFWSSVELKRKLPLPMLPDGEATLDGDGKGIGFNIGALYEPVAGVKLGVSYRSAISVNHRGELDTTLPAPFSPHSKIAGTAKLVFPPSVTWGISLSRFEPFTFNFDVTWTGWSSYDKLEILLTSPHPLTGRTRIVQPKDWRDAWAFRFGANYRLKENVTLRAGYIYDLTPVPDHTFDPQVPDANRHIFTVGKDLKIKRFTLGIAYNYILSENRTKNSRIGFNGEALPPQFQADGRYKSSTHSLGLSTAYTF